MKEEYYTFVDHVSGRIYKFSTNNTIHQVLLVIPNMGLSIGLAINCRTNAETLS